MRRDEMRRMRGNIKAIKALATLGALAALAGGGVALSGCGASATLDPLARAAEVTSQQSGVHISMTMKFSAPGLAAQGTSGGDSFAMTAEGYFDERKRTGEMTMDLSGIPGMSALAGGNGSIKMIFLYPVIYMNMPFLAGKMPGGKPWVKLDISKAAAAAGIDTSQLGSLGQEEDPTKFLEYLRASSGGVVSLGSETVNGVPTTHYSATLQMSRILDRLPGAQQAAAKAALEKLGSAGSIPVEVWVDAQGRVRRMQMSLSGLAGSGGSAAAAGIGGSITIDFKSYGPVPAVVAPPASEVFDMSAMLKGGAAGLGASGSVGAG
jgi:hypothetical protein